MSVFTVAVFACEALAEFGGAAFGCRDPWPVGPWRVVANMLGVAALEVGYPVTCVVLVKAGDTAVHRCLRGRLRRGGWRFVLRERLILRRCFFFAERFFFFRTG